MILSETKKKEVEVCLGLVLIYVRENALKIFYVKTHYSGCTARVPILEGRTRALIFFLLTAFDEVEEPTKVVQATRLTVLLYLSPHQRWRLAHNQKI